MNVYKIRRSDGLFSCGGTKPIFNRVGKTWSSWSNLQNHITSVNGGLKGYETGDKKLIKYYGDCVIETYGFMTETPIVISRWKDDRQQTYILRACGSGHGEER